MSARVPAPAPPNLRDALAHFATCVSHLQRHDAIRNARADENSFDDMEALLDFAQQFAEIAGEVFEVVAAEAGLDQRDRKRARTMVSDALHDDLGAELRVKIAALRPEPTPDPVNEEARRGYLASVL